MQMHERTLVVKMKATQIESEEEAE